MHNIYEPSFMTRSLALTEKRALPAPASLQPIVAPRSSRHMQRQAVTHQKNVATTVRSSDFAARQSAYTRPEVALIGRPFFRATTYEARKHLSHLAETAVLLIQKAARRAKRRKLALLLPGHNEEIIIAETIRSAIAAGQAKNDIYVVDDASSDNTRKIAVELLGRDHVLSVDRSGKALAIRKAIEHFYIEDYYEWVHVADADSVFSENYFTLYREKLDSSRFAVAVGFVQSLRGNWISSYRSYVYTYGQHMNRRAQSWFGMISVLPGPITAFRTDILDKIETSDNSMTEDFDMTLQIHRKKLGKMVFIPQAVNYTQDPQSLSDFYKQTMRWFRGFFQGVQQHKVGTKRQRIDVSIGLQLLQVTVLFLQVFVAFPLVILLTHRWEIIPIALAVDFILCCLLVIASAIVSRRWYVLSVIPYFYVLRAWEILMFYQAFFEVIVLRKYSAKTTGWSTEGRRYQLHPQALKDTAA